MSTVDLTAIDAIVKELYPDGVPQDLALKKHTFLRMVEKKGGFTGDSLIVPMLYDFPGGRSATLASLLAASGPIGASKHIKMTVTRIKDYAATWLDAEMIKATGDDKGSFVRGRQYEIDNMLKALGNSMGHAAYRNGSGSLGTIVAGETVSDTNFTFTLRSDAKHVRVGTQLQFAAAETTGALRDNGAYVTVTAVDESTGQVTVDSTLNAAVPNIAAGDHVYYLGDRNLKLKGLAAWIPLTTPSGGESYFGADRSVQPYRLAGVRLNQANYPIEDLILEVGETINEQGGDPTVCFISHRRWVTLAKRLNAKVEYDQGAVGGTMGSFAGSFPVYLSSGMIRVYPDSDCPDNRGYVLSMDSWKLHHLGELPELVRDDGLSAIRKTGEDAIEIRARYYAQMVCYAPGHNGVFALPSS